MKAPVEMLPAHLDRQGGAVLPFPRSLVFGPAVDLMRPTNVAPSQVLPIGGTGIDEEIGRGLKGVDHIGRHPFEVTEGVGHGVTWAGVAG